MEDPELHTPPAELNTATGHYAPPPDWFSPATTTSPDVIRKITNGRSETQHGDLGRPEVPEAQEAQEGAEEQAGLFEYTQDLPELSSWSWGPDYADVTYDTWVQLYDRSGPNTRWWDFGNL
jgi:hypothetical protein